MSKPDVLLLREVRRFVTASRPTQATDRELIERFSRSRDDCAFGELVRRHGPMVLGVCRRVLRRAADADDAFQATFLVLVRRADAVRDPDRLGAWLFGVAWRVATKLRTGRRPGLPLPDDLPAYASPDHDWPVELDAAIAGLPERYRTPVVLCHLQGLSPAEIGRQLGCPAATIATRLFRARTTLKRRLTARGVAVPAVLLTGTALQVPSALASATTNLATGRLISPAAAHLADGVFRSILMTKMRWAATAAAICLATAGVLRFQVGGQEPAIGAAPPPTAPAPLVPAPALDQPTMPTKVKSEPATVMTANFRVTAPSKRIAQLIADAAERTRRDIAKTWLGKDLPQRTQYIRVIATIARNRTGATTFDFTGGQVAAEMHIEGELDCLLSDVVPHEVTHTVLADHFKAPVPRWADEGIALLSESEDEQSRCIQVAAETANAGKMLQMKTLFNSKDYPADNVVGFFAESFWVTKLLVERRDNPTFIRFIQDGSKDGWDVAAKRHYGFASLDDLEALVLEKLKAARPLAKDKLAPATMTGIPTIAVATADEAGRVQIGSPNITYTPVTTYAARRIMVEENGQKTERVKYEPITSYRAERALFGIYGHDKLKATTVDGTPITPEQLLKTLREKPTGIVFASESQPLPAVFVDLLKPGTIVLVPLSAEPPKATTPKPGGK
ncbi:MAG TPA: sigma-70 family RNA polymerase sigma factor [Gemmataceae bacterium]|jgi:RNA polymerase sigma factor (sigma-70 family)|nr:sigma-70 family RNA polymerase sigma factor [Gemmataceae bacterium]